MISAGDTVLVLIDGAQWPLIVQTVDAQGVVSGLCALGGGWLPLAELRRVTSADKLTEADSYLPRAAAPSA